MSVSQGLLVLVVAGWLLSSVLTGRDFTVSAFLASLVLLLGTGFLLAYPGSLGEADVIFMAGMGLLMDFWQLIFAVAAACAVGMAIWVYQGWRNAGGEWVPRLPFLPCLALGGMMILGVPV